MKNIQNQINVGSKDHKNTTNLFWLDRRMPLRWSQSEAASAAAAAVGPAAVHAVLVVGTIDTGHIAAAVARMTQPGQLQLQEQWAPKGEVEEAEEPRCAQYWRSTGRPAAPVRPMGCTPRHCQVGPPAQQNM